ncbi:hypothetical protein RF11_00685 [Thelohanellus kitauei]|uniref:Uncharacterized protein n=1 Tax=Thelohanellus kitauei TaxID=669202 RepID=A0A0C2MYF6_THEKT|nr:hypothetical protein RF11_00685 [Thelohanellus kitauei]
MSNVVKEVNKTLDQVKIFIHEKIRYCCSQNKDSMMIIDENLKNYSVLDNLENICDNAIVTCEVNERLACYYDDFKLLSNGDILIEEIILEMMEVIFLPQIPFPV